MDERDNVVFHGPYGKGLCEPSLALPWSSAPFLPPVQAPAAAAPTPACLCSARSWPRSLRSFVGLDLKAAALALTVGHAHLALLFSPISQHSARQGARPLPQEGQLHGDLLPSPSERAPVENLAAVLRVIHLGFFPGF